MKIIIDGIEIKTITNLEISGHINQVARNVNLSFVYTKEDKNFSDYEVKINSDITIEDGDEIFKGKINEVNYNPKNCKIDIKASDNLSTLLNSKLFGRFKGDFITILKEIAQDAVSGQNLDVLASALTLANINYPAINILSRNNFTPYDILQIYLSKLFKTGFKLYLDGKCRLKLLTPFTNDAEDEFIEGKNIYSISYLQNDNKKIASLTAENNQNIVSGTIVKITSKKDDMSGYYTVMSDLHTYGISNKMNLLLEDRSIFK